MKTELLAITREQLGEVTTLHRALKASKAERLERRVLESGRLVSQQWFDVVKPLLERAQLSNNAVAEVSKGFETLLLSGPKTRTPAYRRNVGDILTRYRSDIVHQIEIGSFSVSAKLNISPYIDGLPHDEGAFLDEAQRCLSVDALRGCIVLGWCATVSRIHNKIAEIGYDKFSRATEEMTAKTVGRFKPYNKKFSIESMSELQRVFDTELLWVLEYLNLIDSNQHARLRHCFDLRNHSAHPGLAPITGENLYSFFSDISQIVLKNEKFKISSTE